MKRLVYFIALFLMITSLFYNCTVLKNGISYNGEEGIFAKIFNQYPTEYRNVEDSEPNFELGIEFKPHKNGRIRGIRIKNPQTGNLRLSLWDADEQKLLDT